MKQIKSFKIFEGTFRNTSKKCIEQGYTIATRFELRTLIKSKKIPLQFYYAGEVWYDLKLRKITKKEIMNIDKFIQNGGRVSDLDSWDNGYVFYAGGRYVDDDDGRLVGVKFQ